MKLLPYDSLTIATSDPMPVVLQRLSAKVEEPKLFRFSKNHAPYQGTISEQSFRISRIIHYRNSCLPVIRGRFESRSQGTTVHVQMSLHPFVMAFLGFWFICWYSGTIPIALAGAIPLEMAVVFLVMPIIMLFFFWIAFWIEANKSRQYLSEIIQGKIL